MASPGLFKGFPAYGFNGFINAPPLPAGAINAGLVMPTPNSHGAFSTDTDGRKLYLPDGGWIILPDLQLTTGSVYHCFNSNGTSRWSVSNTNINASAVGGFLPLAWLDTTNNALFVVAPDANYITTSASNCYPASIDITAGTITAGATINSVNTPRNLFSAAAFPSQVQVSRAPGFTFRQGMGSGNFLPAYLGSKSVTPSSSVLTPPFSGSTWTVSAGNFAGFTSTTQTYVGYQDANGVCSIDYFSYGGLMRLLRNKVYGTIQLSQIPGGVPTWSGGQTVPATLPQYSNGIAVVNWTSNEVALVGYTTELIFGQRYYPRNLFDAWINNIATYIGLP